MKYYYTDPLEAAWMAKHHGMRFEDVEFESDYESIVWDGCDNQKFFIDPDSLHLLEPWESDVCEIDEGYDGHPLVYRTTEELRGYRAKRIIQRNGKAFMWPELEE